MKDQTKIEREITRYLLGKSSEAEERFEDKYALDPDFLDLVNDVEDDLVDAYVLRRLQPEQREQFERFFLASPDHRDKVAFTEALKRQIESESAVSVAPAYSEQQLSTTLATGRGQSYSAPARLGFSVRLALVGIAIAALGIASWLLIRDRASQRPADQATNQAAASPKTSPSSEMGQVSTSNRAGSDKPSEQARRAYNQEAPQSSKSERAGKSQERRVVASFILSPGLTRSASDTNRIEIPRNADLVELKLSIDSTASYQTYRASLQRVGGGDIWSQNTRKKGSKKGSKAVRSVTVKVPAKLLMKGDYLLTMTGTTLSGESEVVGDYAFTILREK